MSRSRSFVVIICVYTLALAAAIAVRAFLPRPFSWETLLLADLAATVVVFCGSFAVRNTSMYDAYWSVAPPFLAIVLLTHINADARCHLALALVLFWAVRLTGNWAVNFHGLGHEDWRYVDIRQKTGRAYWPASFAALHVIPTLIVFLGCWPLFEVSRATQIYDARSPALNLFDLAATVIGFFAVCIEWIADTQLRRFRQDPQNTGKPIDVGLWRHSRHPNYLGEIGFWWALALYGAAAQRTPSLLTFAGAAVVHAMFVFATIPMAEKHALARRPAYAERLAKTRMLLPLPRRAAG